jgi:hypothetical protein
VLWDINIANVRIISPSNDLGVGTSLQADFQKNLQKSVSIVSCFLRL